ncbi:bcl-2/adenovirus E1B 19 kDa-interacting protein 2-like protein isoform X2 [Pseudoliparis swirei]|uniref:bcl-2/adenovirus E1B 19 kDa-interacting protein 2-like protein isoform X2 n=1 Tax=Pseudoliparis swirei TaxID=2059687 RepID=UPI0024BEDC39|nr:bcl-2/adenovirus E1B 19 kDa-interacting protein 2-like protein isoform X2 [Pseudoliparis swirei]
MSSPRAHTHGSPVGASVPPNIQDMELREEWQDDGFPRPLPEDCGSPEESGDEQPAPPTSLALSAAIEGGAKKRLVAPSLSLTLSRRDSHDGFSAAALSETPSLDINLEALETPSGSETGTLPDGVHELEWYDDLPRMAGAGSGPVPRSPLEQNEGLMDLDQVDTRGRRWRRFSFSGHEYHVNMSVLEPYLQVLSHGGYYGDEMNAVVLFTACYLPPNTVENYEYVMDHLFRYIVGTLDLMVSENYLLVCLCAVAPRNKLPSMKWLHQCYASIDRRLKKDLKGLLVVHPAWSIRALLTVIKPFIRFDKKLNR